jgi:hypothetical protein
MKNAMKKMPTIEFSCSRCRSQSVSYPTLLTDDGHVTCRNCGALLGTLAQFRRIAARVTNASTAAPTTGC